MTEHLSAVISDGGISVFGISLGDYSGEALSALFVILIFLGVWRPKREVDEWRKAAERSADQVDRLIASVEPMVKFIQELKEQTRAGDGQAPSRGDDS